MENHRVLKLTLREINWHYSLRLGIKIGDKNKIKAVSNHKKNFDLDHFALSGQISIF